MRYTIVNRHLKKLQNDYVTKHPPLLRGLGRLFIFLSLFLVACSEEDTTEDEYANWQQRNEQFFASLQDSLSRGGQSWARMKKYSLDPTAVGQPTDYVYVHKLEQGSDPSGESPMYTDSVRVSYQGRLIPTKSYPEGYVFDTTVYGSYNIATTATAKFLVSGLVDGFSTALQHMHRGDRWRVFIPQQLGYGANVQSGIPAYSTLIFDITLVDFTPAGEVMPVWKARRK